MKYNKGDIVKFEDPWLKKSLFDRITTPKGFRNPKYHITGFMNYPVVLMAGPTEFFWNSITTEILEVKHGNMFVVVQEYRGLFLILKQYNSQNTLQYLAFIDRGYYVLLSDRELIELKKEIRKQKMKKIQFF